MCLYKAFPFPFITLKKKKVYKILCKVDDKYKTPFIGEIVDLNEEHCGEGNHKSLIKLIFEKTIGEGYIHCYVHYHSAFTEARWLSKSFGVKVVIFESIIPKFTLYWKGRNRDIATKRILYLEKVYDIHGNRETIYPCRMA